MPEPAVARIDRTVIPFCSRAVEGVPQLSKPKAPKTASSKIADERFLRSVPSRTIENSPIEGAMKYKLAWSFDDLAMRSRRNSDTPLDKAAGEKAHR